MRASRTWLPVLIAGSLLACGHSGSGEMPAVGVVAGTGAPAGATAGASGASAGSLATAGAAGEVASAGRAAAGTGVAGARASTPDAGRGGRGGGRSGGSSGSGAASGAGAGSAGFGGAGGAGMARAGAGGTSGASGAAAGSGTGSGGAAGSGMCPMQGAITYKLARSMSPTAAEQDAYAKIATAMDKAVQIYNCYTNFTWNVNVQYVPSVQTADGNTNGTIRFGSSESMNYITAMHETSHTLGVGGAKYKTMIVDGIFTGQQATRELREVTGDAQAQLHGDQQHFWPYGLNYTNEVKGMEDLIRHCRIVTAMRNDLGL